MLMQSFEVLMMSFSLLMGIFMVYVLAMSISLVVAEETGHVTKTLGFLDTFVWFFHQLSASMVMLCVIFVAMICVLLAQIVTFILALSWRRGKYAEMTFIERSAHIHDKLIPDLRPFWAMNNWVDSLVTFAKSQEGLAAQIAH